MRTAVLLLLAAACADTVVGPTRPTPPVGTWTATNPPPPPPPAEPAGVMPPDPTVHWGLRLRGYGPAAEWGTRPGGDAAPSLGGGPEGFVVAFERGPRPCTALIQDVDLDGAVVPGTLRSVADEPACAPAAAVDAEGRTVVVSDPDTRDAVALHRIDPVTGIERVFDVVTGPRGAGANRPAVAATDDGGVVAAWLLPDGGGGAGVSVRAWDGSLVEVTGVVPLTARSLAGSRPGIAPAGAAVHLAWSEARSPLAAALVVGAWDPAVEGLAWSTEVAAPDRAAAGSPALAVGEDGTTVVAYATSVLGAPRTVELAILGPDGAIRVPAAPLPGVGREPAVAAIGDDAFAVAWAGVEGVGHRVRWMVVRGRDGAILVPSTILSDPALDARAPTTTAAVDGEGGVVVAVAWEQRVDDEVRVVGRTASFGLPAPRVPR